MEGLIIENKKIKEEDIKEKIIKEEDIKEEIYYWYISLVEYHDYTSFRVQELSKIYSINPTRVKSYDEFWNIIKSNKEKNIKEIESKIREKWMYENIRKY